MLIGKRPHYRSDRKTVKIVVDKYKYAEHYSSQLSPCLCLDMINRPFPKSCRTSGTVHYHDHASEHYKKDKDTYIPSIRQLGYHTIGKYLLHHPGKRKSRVQESAGYYTDEQRRIDLLGDECQTDSYYRRHK